MNSEQRIENAMYLAQWSIIPRLLLKEFVHLYDQRKGGCEVYERSIKILVDTIKILQPETVRKQEDMDKRFSKIIGPSFTQYFEDNDFKRYKVVNVLAAWADALDRAEGLQPEYKPYHDFIHGLNKGLEKSEKMKKVDASSLKHVPKVHALAQHLGYF